MDREDKSHLVWLPGETKEDRAKRLAKRRSEKWRERHPNGTRDAAKRWRDKNGHSWPARDALIVEVNGMRSSTPCADCGRTYPAVCMDFDHIRGEKFDNVATLVGLGKPRDLVMTEIAKCELVCANCHRIRTKERLKDDDVPSVSEDT